MIGDSDKPEKGAGEPKPAKIKAEDNRWYLLATLYGVSGDDKTTKKNRVTWNRYFAANLDEETRTKLIEEKRHPAEELTPFSPEEQHEVPAAFVERCKASGKKLALPVSDAEIDFSNVEFKGGVFFARYLFRSSSFECVTFSDWSFFGGATFSGRANFDGATFSGGTDFSGATFFNTADFGGATFSDWAFFSGATFSSRASFIGATFSGGASFRGAIFSRVADFQSATFHRFSNFVNAELKGETSFENAAFTSSPLHFFGAKLHQGTVWRDITWPPVPKNKNEAGAFIDAYACLKLEMDRLKKHEDELDFFALELQSRRVLLGPWRGLSIWLYGILSNYGRSYTRPFLWLLAVVAIGALPLLFSDALPAEKSFGISVANTLNVFGFRKDFFDAAAIENLPALLKILSAVQTILGAILLFLFGLGIRNKFRMK